MIVKIKEEPKFKIGDIVKSRFCTCGLVIDINNKLAKVMCFDKMEDSLFFHSISISIINEDWLSKANDQTLIFSSKYYKIFKREKTCNFNNAYYILLNNTVYCNLVGGLALYELNNCEKETYELEHAGLGDSSIHRISRNELKFNGTIEISNEIVD